MLTVSRQHKVFSAAVQAESKKRYSDMNSAAKTRHLNTYPVLLSSEFSYVDVETAEIAVH